jgi:copper chaperone CopZ
MTVNGVKDAKADVKTRAAWVQYDESKTNPKKLVEAINKKTNFKARLNK